MSYGKRLLPIRHRADKTYTERPSWQKTTPPPLLIPNLLPQKSFVPKRLLHIGAGERPETPQTVLPVEAEDAPKMARGEMNAQQAFMGGVMQVTGAMALAMQFGTAMM